MAAKCCCAPQIDSAKGQIISAIAQNQIKQSAIPQLPQSSIEFPIEAIARAVANLLNRPDNLSFEREVLFDLQALIEGMIALRSRENLQGKIDLLLVEQSKFQAETRQRLDSLATRDQAKDLLFAITDRSRQIIARIDRLSLFLDIKLAAILAAIAALSALVFAQNKLVLAAIGASLARILAAISAIRFPQPEKVDLSTLERGVKDLLAARLTIDSSTFSVPSCGIAQDGTPAIIYQDVDFHFLKDQKNKSTSDAIELVAGMASTLLSAGKLECGGHSGFQSEVLIESGVIADDNSVFRVFPVQVFAYWFVLELIDIDVATIRTYKLAGDDSEFGAGNWAIIDNSGNACPNFSQIFNHLQRLDVPLRGDSWGVRVSPKRGIAFRVTAFGAPIN
jgi:hypothetical protein